MNVTVTKKAHEWIHKAIVNRNQRQATSGIRLGIRTTGCSGLAYTIEFQNQEDELDVGDETKSFQLGFDVISIYISQKDLPIFDGVEIDYATEGLNSGLKFNNPNQRGECGCGESFSV